MTLVDDVPFFRYSVNMMIGSTAKPSAVDIPSIGLNTDKIRQLRERLKLTQEQAAARAGLPSRQKWNDIERGRQKNLTIETLERVAAALGVKARDLLK
jgi:DNA-binding XRE family transcriptional regulator